MARPLTTIRGANSSSRRPRPTTNGLPRSLERVGLCSATTANSIRSCQNFQQSSSTKRAASISQEPIGKRGIRCATSCASTTGFLIGSVLPQSPSYSSFHIRANSHRSRFPDFDQVVQQARRQSDGKNERAASRTAPPLGLCHRCSGVRT